MFFNTTKFYTISFFCKHNFFIDEKHTQWMLDTKVKVFYDNILCFMKWPWNELALSYYVPTCLRAYVPAHPHFSRAYMLTCVYIFFMPTCLCALNYFVPTCTHFYIFTYVPTTTQKIYWGSFLCLVSLFFLNCLTLYFIQNPKTNSCF